ncbi:MAG: hypothetical protein QXK37_05695 [Candidatus Woesearchaeota archaeon]
MIYWNVNAKKTNAQNQQDTVLSSAMFEELRVVVLANESSTTRTLKEKLLTNKAFEKINETLILDYTLEAIINGLNPQEIYVYANENYLRESKFFGMFKCIPPSDKSFYGTVTKTLDYIKPQDGEFIYFNCCDHIFMTPSAHRRFLKKASQYIYDKNIISPVALPDRMLENICGRDYVHTREFSFRVSGSALIRPQSIKLDRIALGYSLRKLEEPAIMLQSIKEMLNILGSDSPRILRDFSILIIARELNKIYRQTRLNIFKKARDLFKNRVPIYKLEGYIAKMIGTEGIKLIPDGAHIGMDIDFKHEHEMYSRHYEKIIERARRIDASLDNGDVLDNYLKAGIR